MAMVPSPAFVMATPAPAGLSLMSSGQAAAAKGSVATSALALAQQPSIPRSSTTVPMALVASLAVAGMCRGRRRQQAGGRRRSLRVRSMGKQSAEVKDATASETARSESRGLLEIASEIGLNLEVRPWQLLTNIAKDSARGWFIKRAEDKGIPWSQSVAGFAAQQGDLDKIYETLIDPSLEYPDYYTQPFHGYEYGNLGWNAAHELEAATQSMCLGYYDGLSWEDAQEVFRGAARRTIADYWQESSRGAQASSDTSTEAIEVLDVGCSGGFSTNEMAKTFPMAAKLTGVDLSPYFLSVAKLTYPHLNFLHANAEDTKVAAESKDVATLNFILHELPLEASRAVLREMHRVLAPGGVIAVLDVDPRRLLDLPPFRRWAFQVTEPWCKEGEYYSLDLEQELESLGFTDVRVVGNDPVNTLVLATKK